MRSFSKAEKEIVKRIIALDEKGHFNVISNIVDSLHGNSLIPNYYYIALDSPTNVTIQLKKSVVESHPDLLRQIDRDATRFVITITQLFKYLEDNQLVYFTGDHDLKSIGTIFADDKYETCNLLPNDLKPLIYKYGRKQVYVSETLKVLAANDFMTDEDIRRSNESKSKSKPTEKQSIMKSQIFISYARPDQVLIKHIVRFLKAAGFPTWYDNDDLLLGQDWRRVIKQEITKSRLLLLCLSTKSVDRTGFFQKEMKLALEQAELQPSSKVFIMPIRLNACEVPEEIAKWHALDLFTNRASDKLLKAISNATGEGARAPISDHDDLFNAVSDYNRDNPT